MVRAASLSLWTLGWVPVPGLFAWQVSPVSVGSRHDRYHSIACRDNMILVATSVSTLDTQEEVRDANTDDSDKATATPTSIGKTRNRRQEDSPSYTKNEIHNQDIHNKDIHNQDIHNRDGDNHTSPPHPIRKPSFADRLQQLRDYRQEHGHVRVPKRYPSLGPWVSKQRQLQRQQKLDATRVQALQELGFCWDSTATQWWDRYDDLQQVLTNTTSSSPLVDVAPRSSLGTWLRKQKQERYTLSHEQQQALHQLDPHWWKSKHDQVWEAHFRELVNYQRRFGDCCVPISWQESPSLAHWVSNQRKSRDSMAPERRKKLDKIGFAWNRWDYEFENWNLMNPPD